MDDRELYAGLIRLHVLHHASKGPVYGLAMIEELGRHGYNLSAGTLYPSPPPLGGLHCVPRKLKYENFSESFSKSSSNVRSK